MPDRVIPADRSHGDPKMLFGIILVDFKRNDLQRCPTPRKDLPRTCLGIRALIQ